ncbi:hypothetical protein B0537_14440 [Desulforamulus ferrireducens]|uniref:Uncharacterized protein n=1 Tax=Desulforamulus ferrireducens TaxID=1833852 RepID=A0A1S6IZH0_9FIRM|nr:hypothetical protein B0537_14440 [Desulforamulus ferrireducens]
MTSLPFMDFSGLVTWKILRIWGEVLFYAPRNLGIYGITKLQKAQLRKVLLAKWKKHLFHSIAV